MFPIVLSFREAGAPWLKKLVFRDYVAQLDAVDVLVNDEAFGGDSTITELYRTFRSLHPDKRCMGIRFPESYYLDDYIHNKEHFIQCIYTCKAIMHYETRVVPIIVKVRSLSVAGKSVIQDLAESFSKQFTFCKFPIILEYEHGILDLRDDFVSNLIDVVPVVECYNSFAGDASSTAYSCFNLSSLMATRRLLDLIEMNIDTFPEHVMLDIAQIAKLYTNCGCMLLSNSKRYGLVSSDLRTSFNANSASFLERVVKEIIPILGIDESRVFIDVDEQDTANRPELTEMVNMLQSILA